MIADILRDLSSGFILAEVTDPVALGELRQHFEALGRWADDAGRADLAHLADRGARLLDELLSDAPSGDEATLERVGETIARVQQDAAPEPAAPAEQDEVDSVLTDFLSDQESSLEDLEAWALALDGADGTAELGSIKGQLHTLKGEAGVLSLMDVAALCHALEDAIEERSPHEVSELLLGAIDWLRKRFEACGAGQEPPPPFAFPIAAGHAAEGEVPPPATATDAAAEVDAIFLEPTPFAGDPELAGEFVHEASEHLEEVDAQLLALEKEPENAEALNSVFRAFHTIKGLAGFLELTCIHRLAHEAETMLDRARCGALRIAGDALGVTFEVNDALKRSIAGIEQALAGDGLLVPDADLPTLMPRLNALAAGRELPAAPGAGDTPAQAGGVPAAPESGNPAQAPSGAGAKAESERPNRKVQVRETIKVDASRLDELVDTIGELVIAEAMVSQSDELCLEGTSRLPGLLTRMDKITRELQEMAMSLRMVPVRSTFRRMARLARDVAAKVDKEIDFVTRGDDTELDKTVVDAIGDPLVHMVRNAVDHGLEAGPEARRTAGKSPVGRIELRAFHQGGSIHIEIEDDGRGLDADRILAKARERGIVGEADKLSEGEIYNLIFAPGFSTAQAVTDVSGRGVGLDVVKRSIESLRGSVEIRSTRGRGSVFSIRLPLTLAIIDGMVVRVGHERYILPTLSIVRMVRPEETKLTRVFDRSTLLKDGDGLVPLFRIDELFSIPGAIGDLTRASAVIVEHGDQRCAFLVDQLLGQQQIVIKPLGPSLAGTPGLAGGAIMGDGQVGLILDIASLVQLAQSTQADDPALQLDGAPAAG